MTNSTAVVSLLFCALVSTPACGDPADPQNENEVITTVRLAFTPQGGGAALTFEFDDPDGDGGDPATIDALNLAPGMYTTTVVFENGLEDPPEDITQEVADESAEHQIFLTGTAVDGPATNNTGAPLLHMYDDQDSNALPVGLTNTISATAGTGDLTLTLRHLPPLNDEPAKVTELASLVRAGGFSSIGGATDAQVTFAVTVQ